MSSLSNPAPGTRLRSCVLFRSGDFDHPFAAEPVEARLKLAFQSKRTNPRGILDLPRHMVGMLGIKLRDREGLQVNGSCRGSRGDQLLATPRPGDE